MVVHIVFFKFRDENKTEHMQKAETMLKALEGRVPSLRSIEVGVNFSQEARAMDMSIVTTFDDKEGLQAYAVDPAHQEVIAYIKEVCEYTKVVDYEK
jgi:hypothetical protein